MVFKAEPRVWTSRFAVRGGIRLCTILKEPRGELEESGEEGM